MELMQSTGPQIADIRATTDLSALLAKIRQIDALKVALESCDRFRENAIRYAQLEAAALIRVIELDGESRLKGHRRKIAVWLADLDDDDRKKFIAMCADGLTIDQVWKREIFSEEKVRKDIAALYAMRENIVENAKRDGVVDISWVSEQARKSLPGKMANDVVDGIRHALRQAGAVGIGNDSRTYVMPTPENADKVKEAILERFNSAAADFAKIREIAKAAKIQLDYRDFDVDIYIADRRSVNYLLHFLIALVRMGVIFNEAEFWSEIAKSAVYAEIDEVSKMGVAHGVDAARLILKNYEAREGQGIA